MIETTIRNSNANFKLNLINNIDWGQAQDLMNWPGVFEQKGIIDIEGIYIITDY